jgi:trehalose synthase
MTTVLNGHATSGRTPTIDDYLPLLGRGEIDGIRALARPLRNRTIVMINSTAVGGGVAEILNRLVPLALDLGLGIRWEVMDGGPDFFRVTKAFHNALHGDPYRSSRDDFDIFLEYNARNRESIALDSEFVVVHDPQPAALIDARKEHAGHWIWRCHIDLSRPNDAVWQFLERYVSRYDAAIFSSPAFSRQLSLPQYLFYP